VPRARRPDSCCAQTSFNRQILATAGFLLLRFGVPGDRHDLRQEQLLFPLPAKTPPFIDLIFLVVCGFMLMEVGLLFELPIQRLHFC
jgi:hypothetical protein